MESAYEHAIRCIKFIDKALSITREKVVQQTGREITGQAKDTLSQSHSKAEFISENIFRCEIISPPMLKKKINTMAFKEYFGQGLLANVNDAFAVQATKGFKKYDRALVIFVSHFCSDSVRIAPYYDNDNLSIKGILDIVVPAVCIDDSVYFCDNIYCRQLDERDYFEIFVIREGSFLEWYELYKDRDFAQNFKQNFAN